MLDGYNEAIEEGLADAQALMRHLEGLGAMDQASRAAVDRARALADRIEHALYAAVRNYPESDANAFAYQALDVVDDLRAAADGHDVGLMLAAAQAIRDRLSSARAAIG